MYYAVFGLMRFYAVRHLFLYFTIVSVFPTVERQMRGLLMNDELEDIYFNSNFSCWFM